MSSAVTGFPPSPAPPNTGLWLHRLACLTVAATVFLIFAGGLVTSTGSGLAVPDWPLSFGQFFPEMTGGVFYEHGHRMVAAVVGLLTVCLATWIVISDERNGVRALALCAALTVVFQGILGGITVLYRLPPQVSVLHACLAQGFLCLAVALAVLTGPGWRQAQFRLEASGAPGLRTLAIATTAGIYGQLILGAVMRHTGAGLAIPDFPLAFGRLLPPLEDPAVRIHFLHRLGALMVLVLVSATVARALSLAGARSWLSRPALLLAMLVVVQISLGAVTVWMKKAPTPASLHVVTGAVLLATSLVLALRAHGAAAWSAR